MKHYIIGFIFAITSMGCVPTLPSNNDKQVIEESNDDPEEFGGEGEGEGPVRTECAILDCESHGLECCNSKCVDVNYDRDNCGACGCPTNDNAVCSASSIVKASFKNVCQYSNIVAVHDGIASDNIVVNNIVNNIIINCGEQDFQDIASFDHNQVDQINGQPLVKNSFIITAGGPSINIISGFNQSLPQSITFSSSDGFNFAFTDTSNNEVLFASDTNQLSDNNDIILIQIRVDIINNNVIMNMYGVNSNGTGAAAEFVNKIIDDGINDNSWFLVKWNAQESVEYNILKEG